MSMEQVTVIEGNMVHVTAKLVIKNFVQIMPGYKVGQDILSDPFMVGDTPMIISVYPNGDYETNKGHVSLYLNNNGDADISLKGELVTDVKNIEFEYWQTFKPGSGLGYSDFLPHAQCTESFKDKDFVVTAKLELPGEPVKVVGNNTASAPKKRKFNVLENVYNMMEKTDFILASELHSVNLLSPDIISLNLSQHHG